MLTTDRSDPGLHVVRADGQNEAYLVLSEEERAKGFVRPYRDSYKHVGRTVCRKPSEIENETWLCVGEPGHEGECTAFSKPGNLRPGCRAVTSMGRALSETYARDPKFYGATFCIGCGTHLPVGEFTWTADGQVVGS